MQNRNNLFRAAGIIGFFTLLSRFVGLYRDRLFAGTFGAGDILDAYNASFRLPDLIFNLLILGTLSVAFIPVLSEYFVRDEEEAKRITNTMLSVTFVFMGLLCAVMYFFVPQITHLIAPGFTGQKYLNAVKLTKIFLLSPIIFTVSNVFSSYLNSLKRFFIVSLAPILYNFGIIIGAKYFYPHYGIIGLGYGVILGALAHLVIQMLASAHAGLAIRPNFNINHPAVRKIGKLFLPRIFGMDQSQFSLIIASIYGSMLASGTITIFSFANNLQAVPIGIFALSFAIAVFPQLSEAFARKDEKEFSGLLSRTIINILFFVIPISILIILLRAQIVRVILGSGRFDWQATKLTANALGIFAISIFSQSLTPLFSRSFFARQNTRTPVYIGLFTLSLNGILSFFFARAYGVLGLAGAFAGASIIDNLILLYFLRRHIKMEDAYISKAIGKILLATAGMAVVTYVSLYVIAAALGLTTGIHVLIQGVVSGLLGVAAFVLFSKWLKISQAEGAIRIVKKRIFG